MPNTHNGDASNLITSKNGTLDRSSTTPTRQQGRMNIHNTKRRHMQHLISQNAAIGSHAENISLSSLERLNNLRRHTIGLNNRQPQLKRLGLNRRRLKLLTTPTNSIGTSNYKRNLIPSLNKRSQRRHSKIWRTHKHNTHKTDPSKPKPRRLQITAPGQVPTKTPDQFNTFKYTQKQRKDRIKSSPLNKANISEDALPWPDGTRERRARKRSPLPPLGLGYCSTRSSARAEEHLMCSSCEQDCLSMEQNLSPAAEGDGGTYSVSPGRAPRARASWYSLTALMRCIGFSRSNMVLPCR